MGFGLVGGQVDPGGDVAGIFTDYSQKITRDNPTQGIPSIDSLSGSPKGGGALSPWSKPAYLFF